MALDIKNFKVTWRGTWKDKTSHKRNDVVYWRGKSYRCIEDTPENYFYYIFGINDQYIFIYALRTYNC